MIKVEFSENGAPLDEKYLNANKLFNGSELIIFDSFEEMNQYLSEHYPTPAPNNNQASQTTDNITGG